jgi:hypothetical protein
MYFVKYMLFICMSKNENWKPKEYYAELIIFSNQIDHIQIIYNNQIKQNYEKNYKTLLFSISQKHNCNSCNRNELTYILDN